MQFAEPVERPVNYDLRVMIYDSGVAVELPLGRAYGTS
jgi:hypothetical protein